MEIGNKVGQNVSLYPIDKILWNFMDNISKLGGSYVWKGICKSKELLKLGLCYQIGNAKSINIWTN